MGPDRIDEHIRDRLDRLRFPNIGPAASEAGDRNQTVMYGRGDDRLSHGPLEEPHDPTGPLVDFVPTKTTVNHCLADGFQLQRTELPGESMTVQLAERSDRQTDAARLSRRFPSLRVIAVSKRQVRLRKLFDRDIAPGGGGWSRETPAVGELLGQEAVELGSAPRGPVLAEIEVSTVQCHQGLPRGFVESV